MDDEQALLGRIAYEIMKTTDQVIAEDLSEDELLSAPELAKRLGMKLDKLKRKLKLLQKEDLIQPIRLSPKRYRFNHFTFERLSETHVFAELETFIENQG